MANTPEGRLKAVAARIGISVEDYIARTDAGLKRCSKCKTWKPLADFASDKSRTDDIACRCLVCGRVTERKILAGKPSPNKGRKYTGTAYQNIVAARYGNKSRTGQKASAEERAKISATRRKNAPRGPAHYAWKGGAQTTQALRSSQEYRDWRNAVYARDSYKCVRCGDAKGGNLNAHHIKPFATFPALRLEVSNGITLCEACHDAEHHKPFSIRNRAKTRKAKAA